LPDIAEAMEAMNVFTQLETLQGKIVDGKLVINGTPRGFHLKHSHDLKAGATATGSYQAGLVNSCEVCLWCPWMKETWFLSGIV
jgi:hypothetical protein